MLSTLRFQVKPPQSLATFEEFVNGVFSCAINARKHHLRRLKRMNRTATTRKITIVPGHKNQLRPELYPPTTTQPGDMIKMIEISPIRFMGRAAYPDPMSLMQCRPIRRNLVKS
jgi:hypothetical protein